LSQCKAFEIPKELVWQAYQQARKNRGAPGFDGETISDFEKDRDRSLYKIWNRLCSGTYFPPPVLERDIPKVDGGIRKLGIPSISDRIAQGAVKIYLERIVEPLFHNDSFGYRPGKSAHQAIEVTWFRCHESFWLLEIDIKAFFDNVDHELIMKALQTLKVPRWVSLYCQRWLTAPMISKAGKLTPRTRGTPQGGVISPLLANLFLHFAIDMWMSRQYPKTKFARYADDLVFHCKSFSDGNRLLEALGRRLELVGLQINMTKSGLVYLGTFERQNVRKKFTFLGYDFEYRTLLRKSDRTLFRKVTPAASKKAMRHITATIKGWKIHRSTADTLQSFATRYNATVRGWIEYYGKFWYRNFSYRLWSALQSRLLKWTKSKFRISIKRARRYLARIQREQPELFAHWYLLRSKNA
jgi:RNA-directed DNA polymerase